ncbi:hypothetical protein Dip518_000724 [Parelusimicrobium proximum]|uniref:hypothetical protein n=1 Tax=Parelusimicrobium proximum TaxID=3228953 RepID=UPI003D172106
MMIFVRAAAQALFNPLAVSLTAFIMGTLIGHRGSKDMLIAAAMALVILLAIFAGYICVVTAAWFFFSEKYRNDKKVFFGRLISARTSKVISFYIINMLVLVLLAFTVAKAGAQAVNFPLFLVIVNLIYAVLTGVSMAGDVLSLFKPIASEAKGA